MTLAITSQGWTYFTLLVVAGPARGRIVNVDPVEDLAEHPRNADLQVLEDALDDEPPRVHTAALRSLQRQGDGWPEDPDPGVRHASMTALHHNGWLTVADRTTLQADPDPAVRARVERLEYQRVRLPAARRPRH